MKEEFAKIFSEVDDPRSGRNQKHLFITLIGVTMLAVLSGITSFFGIAEFAEMKIEHLKKYFDFPGGVPSHDTFQRLWDNIDAEQFTKCFELYTAYLKEAFGKPSEVICIDGKTIRNSGTNKNLHMVSAWCETNNLVLAVKKVDEKSNEIPAAPELIKMLNIKDKIVTADAMGAQRELTEQIIEQEGDYVVSLKGNQGTLHKDVKEYLEEKELLKKCDCHIEYDKGHGRLEERTTYSTDDIAWLQETHNWPGLKSIAVVKSRVEKKGKSSEETRFFISSLQSNAKLIGETARKHWGIENKLHWRLDVIFNEDKACISNDAAAENISTIRKWALNVLQQSKTKPDQAMSSLMRKNLMSFSHLDGIVKRFFHA